MTREISLSELERITRQLLVATGLVEEHAEKVADVYVRATLRGVGHHDIHELPGRVKSILKKDINPQPHIHMLHQFAALESYDGDQGLGEWCAAFAMMRSMELADKFGIGLCAIRNTHHLLASSPYVELAAEQGYIAFIQTRGAPTMGAPGRLEQVVGTSPLGYAVPAAGDDVLMFDACLAYASNGVLADKKKQGQTIPPYWGLNDKGEPTEEPALVKTRLPIGGHKGFGLTLFGEVLTGMLSEGQLIDEPQPGTGAIGKPSHTAVCIKAGGLLGEETLRERTSEMIHRMKLRAPGLVIPGERSAASRKNILAAGKVTVTQQVVEQLNRLAQELQVAPLE